jgi:hypothetical protein
VRVDYLFLRGENIKVAAHGDVPTNIPSIAGLLVEIRMLPSQCSAVSTDNVTAPKISTTRWKSSSYNNFLQSAQVITSGQTVEIVRSVY